LTKSLQALIKPQISLTKPSIGQHGVKIWFTWVESIIRLFF